MIIVGIAYKDVFQQDWLVCIHQDSIPPLYSHQSPKVSQRGQPQSFRAGVLFMLLILRMVFVQCTVGDNRTWR